MSLLSVLPTASTFIGASASTSNTLELPNLAGTGVDHYVSIKDQADVTVPGLSGESYMQHLPAVSSPTAVEIPISWVIGIGLLGIALYMRDRAMDGLKTQMREIDRDSFWNHLVDVNSHATAIAEHSGQKAILLRDGIQSKADFQQSEIDGRLTAMEECITEMKELRASIQRATERDLPKYVRWVIERPQRWLNLGGIKLYEKLDEGIRSAERTLKDTFEELNSEYLTANPPIH